MKKFFTLPNIITFFRILLVPLFMILYLNESFYINNLPLFAILVFLLAFFSDVLDGLLARLTNTQTKLGEILDPFADKILRICVIIAFFIKGVLPLYILIILLAIDCVSIFSGLFLCLNKIIIPANVFGKITTVIVACSLFTCFFHNTIAPYDLIAVEISLVAVFISVLQYMIKYSRIFIRVGRKYRKNQLNKFINEDVNQPAQDEVLTN